MKRIYTGSLLAVTLGVYGTMAQAQSACESEIQALEDRLENADVSDELTESIEDMLDRAEGAENCQEIVASAAMELDTAAEVEYDAESDFEQQADEFEQNAEEFADDAGREIEEFGDEVEGEAEELDEEFDSEFGDDETFADERSPEPSVVGAVLSEEQAIELADQTLKSQFGDEIGEIDEVFRAGTDGQLYVTIDIGGFLGIGEEEKAVPLSSIHLNSEGEPMLMMTEEELEALPSFEDGDYDEEKLAD